MVLFILKRFEKALIGLNRIVSVHLGGIQDTDRGGELAPIKKTLKASKESLGQTCLLCLDLRSHKT